MKCKCENVTLAFRDYAEWTPTTSIHETDRDAIVCSIIGLASETNEYLEKVDELFSDVNKRRQLGEKRADNREQLKKELGDILYYIGLFTEKTGIVANVCIHDPETFPMQTFLCPALPLRVQEHFKKVVRDARWSIADYAKKDDLFESINTLLTVLYIEAVDLGFDFEDVMKTNQEKLMSRFERNVIGGCGDER